MRDELDIFIPFTDNKGPVTRFNLNRWNIEKFKSNFHKMERKIIKPIIQPNSDKNMSTPSPKSDPLSDESLQNQNITNKIINTNIENSIIKNVSKISNDSNNNMINSNSILSNSNDINGSVHSNTSNSNSKKKSNQELKNNYSSIQRDSERDNSDLYESNHFEVDTEHKYPTENYQKY